MANFFGSYLHQDFDLVHGTAWSAVETFAAREPLTWRVEARRELHDLLASASSEEALKEVAGNRLLAYHPPADGLTYREWLTRVERYLADHES